MKASLRRRFASRVFASGAAAEICARPRTVAHLVTLEDIKNAHEVVNKSPHVRRTALLSGFELPTDEVKGVDFMMKLENTQVHIVL